MTFEQVIDLYVKSNEWKRLSPRSRVIYLQGLDKAVEFFDTNIMDISRLDILRFVDRNYKTPGVCRVSISAIRAVFHFACSRGYSHVNPAVSLSGLPRTKAIPRWTEKEVETFLDVAPQHLRLAVLMALYTGQRRSDIIRIKWADYNGTHISLTQKKTGKPLVIPVHPRLKQEIEQSRRTGPYILTNAHGHQWSEPAISQAVRRQAKEAGIKSSSIHGLRKSTASILAESGATVAQIAAITGQSDQMVSYYTRQADQKMLAEKAMELWT